MINQVKHLVSERYILVNPKGDPIGFDLNFFPIIAKCVNDISFLHDYDFALFLKSKFGVDYTIFKVVFDLQQVDLDVSVPRSTYTKNKPQDKYERPTFNTTPEKTFEGIPFSELEKTYQECARGTRLPLKMYNHLECPKCLNFTLPPLKGGDAVTCQNVNCGFIQEKESA